MEKLGKYLILGELGRGAGGVVYRARDPIINRLVALKTITTGLAEFPDLLQRFYQEAQSAGGLQHPNIVTIYDMGDEQGIPYIAMELLEGESLDRLIARRAILPLPVRLTYALQACRALDYAHKRGIIHRDIKPDNVMLTKEGTVKVVDFGIARVLETSRTQTGMLLGTFAYMSPEQYQGEHADARSDIWSFGVLLYELLAYQRPFRGQTPASLMHGICQQEPLSLLEAAPECPAELEKILQRALRKSPTDRYQSMEELYLDLDPICRSLQSESVTGLVAQARLVADQGDYSESRDLLRQALQIDSTHTQARSLLEKVNVELRRIQLRPKMQQQVEKGHTLLAEGKAQEARAAAEAALQMDTNFEPAQVLLRLIQEELERARLVAEWIESSRQRLAEGNPEEAEDLLAKVLEIEPSNQQVQILQLQVNDEKETRKKRQRLYEQMQLARSLWTQQHYAECIQLLTELQKEFSEDGEIPRLLEAAREDQANQRRLQGLAEARSLLANQRYDGCTALLADLQKQFPSDCEIPKLQKSVIEDQRKQRKLQSLAEARSLLAARRHDDCVSLLTSLQKDFPGDDEILELQESVAEDRRKQRLSFCLTEARSLLGARRYDACVSFLTSLQKEFPDEDEIRKLFETAREDRAEQQRHQEVAKARKALASRQYEECKALLLRLQKEFPDDDEIPKLLDLARKEQAEHHKLESLTKARVLLASRLYEECVAFVSKLQGEYPGDSDVVKLLQTAREEQAEHQKLQGVAEARNLLASRHYDQSISLLVELQKSFPDEEEIARLLETAREDRAEQQKQHKLSEARSHLAARRFEDAIAVLETLREAHPNDPAVQKLRDLVRQEKEKQDTLERLQRELKAVKKLVSEKKYTEVLAQAERISSEFRGDPDLARLVDFARSQQVQIERDLQLRKTIQGIKELFDANRFDDAYQGALAGLKTFPGNRDLQFLREQADTQQRKLETRQHIELRIRDIKFKINRGKFSEAIDLANQTLVTMGPDTDLTQLLNSAQVEYDAREKKREQEAKLQTIRTLMESGKFDDATRTLDEAVATKTLEGFDSRVQRLLDEIEAAKTAASAATSPGASVPPVSLSKEYAWLQRSPSPEVPAAPPEKQPPTPAPDPKAAVSPMVLPAPPVLPPSLPVVAPTSPAPTVQPSQAQSALAGPMRGSTAAPATPVQQIGTQQYPATPVSRVLATPRQPEPVSVWQKPTTLAAAMVLALIAMVWAVVHSLSPKNANNSSPPTATRTGPPTSEINPLEAQQRDAINAADKLVAANDLEAAVRTLDQAAGVNGPLAGEIRRKRTVIEESMRDKNLRKLRQGEEQLWQRAKDDVTGGRFTEAQNNLRQILTLGDGGLRKNDAQQYLAHTIPTRQREEKLFARALRASQGTDSNSLQDANNLLGQVIALDGQRKSEAEHLQTDVRTKLNDAGLAAAREDLQRGDFRAAQLKAAEIQQNGGDPRTLSAGIYEAEGNRLTQLENQFNQLRQSDDDAAAQQLSNLQRAFQVLGDDTGPRSNEAKSFLSNIPAAIREVHERAANKRAESAYQQILSKYQQASSTNDKSGLETARSAFQSVAQGGGPHANDAQKFLDEISTKLAAPSQPLAPPPTPVKAEPSSGPADSDAVMALITRYAQAFEQRDPNALRQIWPTMGKRYAGYKNSFESASSIRMQVQTEGVKMSADGASAIVTAQVTQEYTPQGQKPRSAKGRSIFQLAKQNGTWAITDVQ
jgi:serine/threonine protein kinase